MFGGGFSPGGNLAQNYVQVDDDWTDLQKIQRCVRSESPGQRRVFTEQIEGCAKSIGVPETIRSLLPLLPAIVADKAPEVRQAVAKQLTLLCPFLASTPQGMEQIKDVLVQHGKQLLDDDHQEVRQLASEILIVIAELLDGDDVGFVLAAVLQLAHDERDEAKVTAIGLMAQLAPLCGPELVQHYIAKEITSASDDPTSWQVRKVVAQSYGSVCQIVGPEVTVNQLLPSYRRLCEDDIWGVRKGCVDCMVAVCKVVPPEVQREVFVPMFERFTKDTSRWVRNGAFEILGPLLYTLGSELISPQLLKYFSAIPAMTTSVVDPEVNYFCAFNFPAVVQTLGAERWGELETCFLKLSEDIKFHVRKCLAAGLHHVANTLGRELTEKALLPVVDKFFKDLEQVRVHVVKNIAAILAVISPKRRLQYLPLLNETQAQAEHWRWRLLLAEQLGALCGLFSAEVLGSEILMLFFNLCRDSVWLVKIEATKHLGVLMKKLHEENTEKFIAAELSIRQFRESESCHVRQVYVCMVEGMVEGLDPKTLEKHFLMSMLSLVRDRVPNVRLTLGRALHNTFAKHPYWSQHKAVKLVLRKLQGDAIKDVSHFATRRLGGAASEGEGASSSSVSSLGGGERPLREEELEQALAELFGDAEGDIAMSPSKPPSLDESAASSPPGTSLSASPPVTHSPVTRPGTARPVASPVATSLQDDEEEDELFGSLDSAAAPAAASDDNHDDGAPSGMADSLSDAMPAAPGGPAPDTVDDDDDELFGPVSSSSTSSPISIENLQGSTPSFHTTSSPLSSAPLADSNPSPLSAPAPSHSPSSSPTPSPADPPTAEASYGLSSLGISAVARQAAAAAEATQDDEQRGGGGCETTKMAMQEEEGAASGSSRKEPMADGDGDGEEAEGDNRQDDQEDEDEEAADLGSPVPMEE